MKKKMNKVDKKVVWKGSLTNPLVRKTDPKLKTADQFSRRVGPMARTSVF